MMSESNADLLSRKDFERIVCHRRLLPLEEDTRMYNLAPGYWVYDEVINDLRSAGWIRFGPGFKAGIFGHSKSDYCIKLMGMGVGQNPLYFCEKGYYIEHERKMLLSFRNGGFMFSPDALDQEESINFLIRDCGISPHQANLRVRNNDLLVAEHIPGVPLATQTGYGLNYDLNIDAFHRDVVEEMLIALQQLWLALHRANIHLLLHNDPMPPNIIFSLNENREITARLVDFELAQDLREPSPDHVSSTVELLYKERHVPVNPDTRTHVMNLDQHLMDGSINLTKRVYEASKSTSKDESLLDALSIGIPFIGSLNTGKALKILKRLASS